MGLELEWAWGWSGVGLGVGLSLELRWAWAWGPPSLLSPRPAGGETEEEILRVDVLENQIMDFRMSLVMICYNPDFVSVPVLRGLVAVPGPSLAVPWVTSVWGRCCPLGWGDLGAHHPFLLQEKLKPGYLEQLPGKLKLFSNFLGDRKWFAGEKVPWRPRLWGLGRGFVPTLVLTVSPRPVCPPPSSPSWTSSCSTCWSRTASSSPSAWSPSRTSRTSWSALG